MIRFDGDPNHHLEPGIVSRIFIIALSKASLTSHRTCTYVLVNREKLADLQGTLKVHLQF